MDALSGTGAPTASVGKGMNGVNKYHNKRTMVDGIEFQSKREAERWCELKLLERAGLITDLFRQFPIKLIPAQKDENGKVIERAVGYVADFVYKDTATGKTIYEDVKGVRTKEYLLKRKMCLYFHGIRIKEV